MAKKREKKDPGEPELGETSKTASPTEGGPPPGSVMESNEPAARPSDAPFTVETLEQFKALAHPLRQRLLECFATRPQTTKQVADQLGEKPTRLYHHVNALESAGFIHIVETRPKRGTTEKYYSAVARRIQVEPHLLMGKESQVSVDMAGLGLVEGILDNLRAELGEVLAREADEPPDPDGSIFAQFEVHATADELREIRRRLDAFMQEIERESKDRDELEVEATEGDGPDLERQRLIVGWYPLHRDSQ